MTRAGISAPQGCDSAAARAGADAVTSRSPDGIGLLPIPAPLPAPVATAAEPPIAAMSPTSPASSAVIAVSCADAGAFWGSLTPDEDAALWSMRAEEVPFPVIRTEIEARRAFSEKQRRNRANGWARHFREQIRKERGR